MQFGTNSSPKLIIVTPSTSKPESRKSKSAVALSTPPLTATKHFSIPINTDPAFREVDVGEWTLQLISDVEKNYPDLLLSYRSSVGEFRFPGGESFEDTEKRASEALKRIAEKHDGQTVLIVSHGGTIRTMICHLLGYPIKELHRVSSVRNASVTVAEYENGKAEILLRGDISHLPEHLK